jgi:hypothetical protein
MLVLLAYIFRAMNLHFLTFKHVAFVFKFTTTELPRSIIMRGINFPLFSR